MIKLNNKNITHVALADSNNSTKGVKEIWYADSNNSVKLVYRRKDALIEGEDYEKYHWLVGDADAYINTLKYYRPYDDSVQMTFRDNLYPNRKSKYNKYNLEEQIWGGGVRSDRLIIRSYISGANGIRIGNNIINKGNSSVNWFDYTIDGYINGSEFHNLYISNVTDNKYSFTYNGSQKDNLSTINTLPEIIQGDVLVFVSNEQPGGYFNGSFFNFIHYRNNVEITHLIPCKLLKPVPKWLDANGIRRQVGECGMIDLVSGKFYGNVNSNGTFTVENYYERKEWLVGDGSAYIDTGHNVNEDLDYETKVHLLPNTYLFWYRTKGNTGDNTMVVRSDTNIHIGQRVANNSYDIRITDTDDAVEIKWEGEYVDINDTKYHVTKHIELNHNFNLFYIRLESSQDTSSYTSNNVKCSYFRFLDSNRNYIQNLIPCTLTMDLPASMDANNIARTKGTSGMWDLVSDKFYGNVANSGTFKAVNLAEGVDYEVHDWLVATIPVGVSMMNLSLNTNDFYFKREWHIFGNVSYFSTDSHAYFTHYSNRKVAVYDKSTGDSVVYGSGIDPDIEVIIDSNSSRTLINNIDVPMYGDTATSMLFQNAANGQNTAELSTSAITVDGSVRYIPVKLLRSIPAKYDANGIARNAGECGMYDTVNDVFYGNVASSGTFSVSDDS